jgi:ankyrin repeat protein
MALPAHPNLDQLRHQAKDLLNAARSGDTAAAAQIAAVSERPTLSAAQLAVARSYGFPSWPRLKAEVEARTASLDQKAAEFCVASVKDWTGRAARMLAETPELAGHSLATALMLGDVARVRAEIERDPAAATRADPRTGWTPLHAVSASRWPDLDPARAEGLVATARLLLEAGADPGARIRPGGLSAGSSPLRCATASASAGGGNAAIMRLLLEHGAVVGDDDLYLAAFSRAGDHRCLRVLLDQAPAAAPAAQKALAAPISTGDVEGVRLLLEAGADPRRFADDEGQPSAAVCHAVRLDAPAELIALLIDHGADPSQPGPDGLTPAFLATVRGRSDLPGLLGLDDDALGVTDAARFVGACMRGDRAAVTAMTTADPALPGRLTEAEHSALVHAAEAGNEPAVSLMLDLDFPIGVRRDDGATALHAAAYAGSVPVVRLLLDRGADLEAPDGQWQSPALDWAVVGSGQHPKTSPHPDWVTTVRVLIEAGASTEGISLSPDDPKAPSAEVADLLRALGVRSTA